MVPTPDSANSGAIALVVNERHAAHRIPQRGYLETPARIPAILRAIEPTGLFEHVAAREFPEKHLRAVHDAGYLDFLRRASRGVPEGEVHYADSFAVGMRGRPPVLCRQALGYYGSDGYTGVHRRAFEVARHAVDCVLTAAEHVRSGRPMAYALVRPPGHHAQRRAFGGYCYLNNTAAAAEYLSVFGRVAIVDLDYHHGNGTQDIFWERGDVLAISIHGHPRSTYPHFTGYADERGAGPGEGRNVNLPLPESADGRQYRRTLAKTIGIVADFAPKFLVIALGLDTAEGDPCGSFRLGESDFQKSGRMLGQLGLPTVVVQEGGYLRRTLGASARSFFAGLAGQSRLS
jgi:acetoin utilization deacetylase AcuC-like enzyme